MNESSDNLAAADNQQESDGITRIVKALIDSAHILYRFKHYVEGEIKRVLVGLQEMGDCPTDPSKDVQGFLNSMDTHSSRRTIDNMDNSQLDALAKILEQINNLQMRAIGIMVIPFQSSETTRDAPHVHENDAEMI